MSDEVTRHEFTEYMEAFEQRLHRHFDSRLEGASQAIKVQFEDVRRDIRLSLEAVEGLREVTERRFGDLHTELTNQTSLIHDALRHVRRRVETVERRPTTKRR